jgi:hypothetical protein
VIMGQNGLMSLLVHPDYVIESRAQSVYRDLLGYLADLREHEGVWTPLPREVAQWWQLRSRMKLIQEGGTWRIEGPGKERARIAYARVADGAISYRVQDETAQVVM